MKRALAWIFEPMLAHRRTLLAINGVYFGTVVLGALYALAVPQAQQALLESVGQALSPTGALGPVAEAYREGRLVPAILITFLVNLILGSALEITLPSMAIPFFGLLMGVLRALLWGILFSPGAGFGLALAPHLLTILLEGEAYVVAVTGVWLWWWPVVSAQGNRWDGWRQGLRLQARVYVAVAFLLAVSAVYEVLEVIYLVPRLV